VNQGFVVGLTGGIGSGKSTVADLFARQGIAVVDTDAIAHQLTGEGGAALPALRAAFGDDVVTPEGALDRAVMRSRAFADETERKRLEAILHPLIRQESERRVAAAVGTQNPYTLLVVPLLIESGDYRGRVNRVLVVDCAPTTQMRRVMARNGLAQEEIERILATQATREMRLAAADDVIMNDGEPAALFPQVARLHHLYLDLARYTGHAAS
jgi:dephospho-CoA kinase